MKRVLDILLLVIIVFASFGTVSSAAPGAGPAQGVAVILVADNSADLAAASALGGKLGLKVVVTPWGTLGDDAIAQINASGATQVYVVGGPVAVPEVEAKLQGFTMTRLGGKDRFETSALVVGRWNRSALVFLVEGADEEGAREATVKARAENAPIVYVKKVELPEAVGAALARLNASRGVLVPSPDMEKEKVKARLRERGLEVNETPVDFAQRAQNAIAAAEKAVESAEANASEVNESRSAAAARLLLQAKLHLADARDALNASKYGEAYGLAVAAKHLAENSGRITRGVIVGSLREDVERAAAEIGSRGLEGWKKDLDVAANNSAVGLGGRIGMGPPPRSRR